jgi:hypothetical protein
MPDSIVTQAGRVPSSDIVGHFGEHAGDTNPELPIPYQGAIPANSAHPSARVEPDTARNRAMSRCGAQHPQRDSTHRGCIFAERNAAFGAKWPQECHRSLRIGATLWGQTRPHRGRLAGGPEGSNCAGSYARCSADRGRARGPRQCGHPSESHLFRAQASPVMSPLLNAMTLSPYGAEYTTSVTRVDHAITHARDRQCAVTKGRVDEMNEPWSDGRPSATLSGRYRCPPRRMPNSASPAGFEPFGAPVKFSLLA